MPFPTLAVLDCERTHVRPPIELPATSLYLPQTALSLPSSVLYYECDITLSRPFGSDKPTPASTTLPLPFLTYSPSTSCQCFIKHYDSLQSITPTYVVPDSKKTLLTFVFLLTRREIVPYIADTPRPMCSLTFGKTSGHQSLIRFVFLFTFYFCEYSFVSCTAEIYWLVG